MKPKLGTLVTGLLHRHLAFHLLGLPLIFVPLVAVAQQCPASPPVMISSQMPADVCIPSNFSGNPIAFFDDFSWRSFVAAVWPVQHGARGVPDTSKVIGSPGPLVFETFKAEWEVFQPSPDGSSPPSAPSAWESYDGQNPCSTSDVSFVGFSPDLISTSNVPAVSFGPDLTYPIFGSPPARSNVLTYPIFGASSLKVGLAI
ncbi:hypothetical protein [Bradyrhizobium sp. URHC0002]